MHKRCDRNRKRSKRRSIYCPIHGCYINSVSQKYPLFADKPGQLQERGMSRKIAMMLVSSQTAVPIPGEWLEAFWCEHCHQIGWYHVRKRGDSIYELEQAPRELWQQVSGVTSANGNPSVGEFTQRQGQAPNNRSLKDFKAC